MPQLGEIKSSKELGYKGVTTKHIWAACITCGKERWVQFTGGKPKNARCISCVNKTKTGELSHNWKGGRRRFGDYITVRLQPNDFFYPMADKRGYVLEHRLIMAKHLNRCLLPWETVHHREGYAKDDNRYPQTLELLPSPSSHNALTRMITYIKKLEREVGGLRQQLRFGKPIENKKLDKRGKK